MSSPFGICPGVIQLSHTVNLFLVIWGFSILSSRVAAPIYVHSEWSSSFSTSPAFVVSYFMYLSHSFWCERKPHSYFNLYFPKDEKHFLRYFLTIFLLRTLFRPLVRFLNWVIYFLDSRFCFCFLGFCIFRVVIFCQMYSWQGFFPTLCVSSSLNWLCRSFLVL